MNKAEQIRELRRLIRDARHELVRQHDHDKAHDLRDTIVSMEQEISELKGDKS